MGLLSRPVEGESWSTYHGTPSLDGRAPIDLPGPLVERWRVRIGAPPVGAPVGGDGAIYVITEDGDLVSVDLEGQERWRSAACSPPDPGEVAPRFRAPPLFAGDSVVVASAGGSLCALRSSDGRERWRYAVGAPVTASPNLFAADESLSASVVVSSQADGAVHRVDLASGRGIGVSPSTARCDGGVAVRGDTIAFGNCAASLYALSGSSLQVLGRTALSPEGEVFAGVALSDGIVYAGDRSGRLYAARVPSEAPLWVNDEARDEIAAPPALASDRVVASSRDGSVAALERSTGLTLWRSVLGGQPSGPVVTTGGQVLVGSKGSLYLLDLADGSTLQAREISDEISAPAVIGGLVLVGTDDGFLVAFGPGSAREESP